jgi:hypothetical protein
VKKCNGRFIFITATVTRPELLEKSEKLLNLEDGTIEWRNWTSLYFVIEKILEEPVNIDETSIKFLVELRGYLEWLRMGYDLGNLMEKYKEIYKEGWLEILGEKFDDFVRELRRDFANQLDEATVLKKYGNISVSSDAKRDLFDASWINFSSKEIEKVNDRLYYYLLFDMSSFQWYVVLGGTKKQIREQFREIILEEKTHGFLETSENTGSDWIVGCPIVKKPDFSNPTVLKKELVEKTLHSIITMDDYIKNKISN